MLKTVGGVYMLTAVGGTALRTGSGHIRGGIKLAAGIYSVQYCTVGSDGSLASTDL